MLYACYRQHVDREIGILSATIILALMHSVAGKLEKKVEQINQFFKAIIANFSIFLCALCTFLYLFPFPKTALFPSFSGLFIFLFEIFLLVMVVCV